MEITAITVINLQNSVRKQIKEDEYVLKDYFTERQIKKIEKELNEAKETNLVKLAFVFSVKRMFRNKILIKYMEKKDV